MDPEGTYARYWQPAGPLITRNSDETDMHISFPRNAFRGSGLCAPEHPLDYVNMMVGTTGKHRTEYGGTTPAVSTPFGMTQWCVATRRTARVPAAQR